MFTLLLIFYFILQLDYHDYLYALSYFLAYLSRRLKLAIVIVHRPSVVCRPSGVNFHIFDFSSETADRNSTKLDRKQDLNVLYQVCVFRADQKNKMAALASDWLRHFRLLLWNRWTEFNETWQEARTQRLLQSLCFWADRKNKMAALASDWLRHFWLLLWNLWTELKETWQKARSQRPLPSLCFSGRSKKTRWPPWPLIGWDIFDFSFETAERNSTKLDRKQDLNALHQVCVSRADQKNKMAAIASDWLRNFRLLWWNRWTKFKDTWQEARSQSPLPSLCFSGWSEKQDGRPSLWLAETFSTSSLKPLNGIQRNLTGSKISTLSTKFVFLGWSEKQDGSPSLWLAEKFRLLFWKRWTEFNETWQEARSQRPLPSLCFSGWSVKKMAAMAHDWLRHFGLLLWNYWTGFKGIWQEARSQHLLPSCVFQSDV